MRRHQKPTAQPTTAAAASQPPRIRPRQVWQTLTPGQQQQVLGRLVVMCQECLLWPPLERSPRPEQHAEEDSHDDEHIQAIADPGDQ